MKEKSIVYLAGPMNGVKEFNRPAFRAAEEALRSGRRYVVINPAMLPVGLEPERYMPICLAMIDAADMICLLDGWEKSPGARLEKVYAEHQAKEVFRLVDGALLPLLK